MLGFAQPVVFGKEIGQDPKYDLIARYAKACDSTKSPSILQRIYQLV